MKTYRIEFTVKVSSEQYLSGVAGRAIGIDVEGDGPEDAADRFRSAIQRVVQGPTRAELYAEHLGVGVKEGWENYKCPCGHVFARMHDPHLTKPLCPKCQHDRGERVSQVEPTSAKVLEKPPVGSYCTFCGALPEPWAGERVEAGQKEDKTEENIWLQMKVPPRAPVKAYKCSCHGGHVFSSSVSPLCPKCGREGLPLELQKAAEEPSKAIPEQKPERLVPGSPVYKCPNHTCGQVFSRRENTGKPRCFACGHLGEPAPPQLIHYTCSGKGCGKVFSLRGNHEGSPRCPLCNHVGGLPPSAEAKAHYSPAPSQEDKPDPSARAIFRCSDPECGHAFVLFLSDVRVKTPYCPCCNGAAARSFEFKDALDVKPVPFIPQDEPIWNAEAPSPVPRPPLGHASMPLWGDRFDARIKAADQSKVPWDHNFCADCAHVHQGDSEGNFLCLEMNTVTDKPCRCTSGKKHVSVRVDEAPAVPEKVDPPHELKHYLCTLPACGYVFGQGTWVKSVPKCPECGLVGGREVVFLDPKRAMSMEGILPSGWTSDRSWRDSDRKLGAGPFQVWLAEKACLECKHVHLGEEVCQTKTHRGPCQCTYETEYQAAEDAEKAAGVVNPKRGITSWGELELKEGTSQASFLLGFLHFLAQPQEFDFNEGVTQPLVTALSGLHEVAVVTAYLNRIAK